MYIENVETNKLYKILSKKKKELEEFKNSEDYEWLRRHQGLERDYYYKKRDYKKAVYKKYKLTAYFSKLKAEIESIERELDYRSLKGLTLKKK